ncbi:MAG: CDP-glycerol glycerophosphotransferase family protein [Patescibacteria group bacterium]
MKTIFINLFSILAMDNFTVPDGVIDQLIRRKGQDIRLVLLTGEKLLPRLAPYANGQTVIVEAIKSFPPRGFIQKLFHFFYAFLIFTGSTKVLATFGARADIPPAGGNRHMWFFKSLIANTFGQSLFVKRRLTPWLFKIIFRERPYQQLFARYQPDLVMTPAIAFFPDVELVSEAKRWGVKTIGMVMNWDHLNKYFIPIHADWLLVQNEPMRREALNWHAYSPEQISIVGFPQFDMYAQPDKYLVPKVQFKKAFGLEGIDKTILFISGAAYSLDEPDIIKEISKWISEGKFGPKTKLLIRPYAIARDIEREREKYKSLENDPNIVFNWQRRSDSLESKKNFMSMLAYADVIISIFSTTAIESAIFDKPTITIGFDGYKKRQYHQSIVRLEDMSHFRNVLETGSVKVVRSFPDLLETLISYIKNPAIDADRRKVLVNKMCYKIDGGAANRITDFILEKTNA